jgi:uncharacterized protein (UPF0332 family)/predicted nucleotidyltransferase
MEHAEETKKREALRSFIKNLRHSEVKDSIAKIVLFGSMARGDFSPESDVDVLVFATDKLAEVSKACAEASLWTGIEKKESVEPLIRCADKLLYTDSYFLTRALQEGEEVYGMAEEELAKKGAENSLRLAEEYLELARYDLEGKQFRGVVDAGYNAAELCVKGLLTLKPEKLPRTHGGIVQKFGELYVQAGLATKEVGRSLNQALQFRNDARYDFHAEITREKAEEVIKLAETLVGVLKEAIV